MITASDRRAKEVAAAMSIILMQGHPMREVTSRRPTTKRTVRIKYTNPTST
jgi:hypothetical protein